MEYEHTEFLYGSQTTENKINTEYHPLSSSEGLKTITRNVRSLCNKLDELSAWIEASHPDIVALTGSWLTPNVSNAGVHPMGYETFRTDRTQGRAEGGGTMYCHDYLNPVVVTSKADEDGTAEVLFCRIRHRWGSATVVLIYETPKSTVEIVLQHLENIAASYHCLIMGDLNASYFNRGMDIKEMTSKQCFRRSWQ